MTDEQPDVAALEKKFQETGALDDEVAFLRARRGQDALEDKRQKCAAFFGHEAATKSLDIAPTPEWELRDTDIWISRLKPLGKEAFVRTVIAVLRGTVPASDARATAAIDAAQAWALCPCEDHRKAAEKALEAAEGSAGALAAKCASRTVAAASQQDLYHVLKNLDPAATPRLVAAALVPWLLGRADPLKTGAPTAAPPAADDLDAAETAALDAVVAKLKKDPATLMRELARRLTADERADVSRRILERRTFDN